jgi:hypothetical protein
MKTMLRYHHYKIKNKKDDKYIQSIIPVDDRQVPDRMFERYEDVTERIANVAEIPEEE